VQLLPIFLALASFGLQDGAFQVVFTDNKPRDWYTPMCFWSLLAL
jgi:hypothetical protein